MISSEVQRTLVKSPPELWAELSDPTALTRHLGELGEIRITHTEPEKTVEWEAENTTGTVSIQPSGWGTRVTLSVTRELVGAAAAVTAAAELTAVTTASESKSDLVPEPVAEETMGPEPTAAEPEPAAAEPAESEPAESEPAAAEPAAAAPEPRRGFFSRLFGRRRKTEAAQPQPSEHLGAITDEPVDTFAADTFAAVREALTPESLAAIDLFAVVPATQPPRDAPHKPEPEQRPDAQREQIADIAAELRAAEEVAEEEVTAVLAGVLDRLGAAHHRPFSRS